VRLISDLSLILAVQNHFFLLENSNYSSVETHNNAQMHVEQQLNDYEHPLLIHTLILSLSLSVVGLVLTTVSLSVSLAPAGP